MRRFSALARGESQARAAALLGASPAAAATGRRLGFAWNRLLYKNIMSSFIGAVLRDTAHSLKNQCALTGIVK
jgi:hypothetical protein